MRHKFAYHYDRATNTLIAYSDKGNQKYTLSEKQYFRFKCASGGYNLGLKTRIQTSQNTIWLLDQIN